MRNGVLDALLTPFPPVAAGARLLGVLKAAGALRLARLAVTPVRRLGEETFRGDGGRLLLTGNAMHADVPPDGAGSGLFGWLLAMLGQDVGFPVPRGGAGVLAHALAARAESLGAQVRTNAAVAEVLVRGRRAHGVRLVDGSVITARRAILADVPAPALYSQLLGKVLLPTRLRDDIARFGWDNATLKLNWALDHPVPWLNEATGSAGTVHVGVDVDGFVDFGADLSVGRMPERPFILFGQMTTADPSRSPAGTESAWAYTHLPRRHAADAGVVGEQVARVEEALERAAPGFAASVLARTVQSPADLEAANASLVDGALNAGTAAIHQQLVFRPTPGVGRPETPIDGLYLASASAHPGGGVHGACGWNAARAALRANGRLGLLHTALVRTAWERVLRD
ncbi:MAG TPA: NAD(P)/FAD-dependent oxidoreductase [Propionicimonas sp.]|nr:NAD(P)/FAD-dependent oxidoreductase [Propionicimonas sp.]